MIDSILKDMFARALAEEILNYVDFVNKEALIERVNHNAIELLEEIRYVLDDTECSDPECFYRIDAIVAAYRDAGIFTERHQEVD